MQRLLCIAASLFLAIPANAQVRNYGPLRVDLSKAKQMDEFIVVPAKNPRGQYLYVGVFCKERLFNFTGAEFKWKQWNSPETMHEARIVADMSNQI